MTTTYYVTVPSLPHYETILRVIRPINGPALYHAYFLSSATWYPTGPDSYSTEHVDLVTESLSEAIIFVIEALNKNGQERAAAVWLKQI